MQEVVSTPSKLSNNLGTATETQYDTVVQSCKDIYLKKVQDYGTSWRMLRPRSLTDQIFIKAKRIRNIEELGTQQINEGIDSEFKGIINYCIIALIQTELHADEDTELTVEQSEALFDKHAQATKDLMLLKNHDYGEAWRDLRPTSFTDLILMKLMRLKQIEDNDGKTVISEGVEANYMDIINYAIFALIKMDEL